MTVEEAILSRVASLAPVVALVGTRVHLEMLPQSPTYPCVRVTEVDDPGSYQLRGPDGLGEARVQVDAFARDGDAYSAAAGLAEAIDGDGAGPLASGLSGWVGAIGSPPFVVLACQRIDRRRQYDPDEVRVLMMSQDYRVTYRTS